MQKIHSFTDLIAWKQGHQLVLAIYAIISGFPKHEAYALSDQIKRCVVSITNNIAEGFSRRTSKDKIQFYYISLGSVTELQNQLIIAQDLKYLTNEQFKNLYEQAIRVHKLIFGLIKSAKSLNT